MTEHDGKYRIGAVSRMTGISTHALRVWERRYAAVEPMRTPGGDRLFSDRDVIRLRTIKRLIEQGHPVSHVARLDDDDLFRLIEEAVPTPPPAPSADDVVRGKVMAALRELDLRVADALLHRAAVVQPARTFLDHVVAPLLVDIGDAWAAGELRIAHEHAASSLLRNLVGTLTRLESPVPGAPTVVATTMAGELHEFGALMASLTAASLRWNTLYLGPNLPADEIVHATEASGAEVLFLSCVGREQVDAAEVALLDARLAPEVSVVVGGAAATLCARHFRRRVVTECGSSMDELRAWIDEYERERQHS